MPAQSLTAALVAMAAAPVAAADRERAALHLLDWLACALAASNDNARHPLLRHYRLNPPVGLTFADPKLLPETALMLDGVLGSLLEMDDVHRAAVLHPGPVIIPAALIAARHCQATPAQLLDGLVRGYEIMIRIGRGMGRAHYAHWHPTSTCGGFGAAMAVASITDLTAQQQVWALGNAGTRCGGLWQLRHEDVPSKALHTALAARDGWLAAMLAANGFAGPKRILEGPQGLLAATASDADPAAMLTAEPDWLIHQVSFKPWPACRHAHPAIDALLALDPPPVPDQIRRIDVHTYREAVDFCDRARPEMPAEARFSIQHALAAALIDGRPCLVQYDRPTIDRHDIALLRERIQVQADPAFSARFPAHYGARIDVHLTDDSCRTASINDAWGDPENPLAVSDLAAKARDLFSHVGIGQTRAESLIQATLDLAGQTSLDPWLNQLAASHTG